MVLSWHKPESLYAEVGLLVLALLIYGYRLLGGKNEWFRTHGCIIVTYYAVGGLVFDELEGWPLLETTYFLTVTITTVGYGDIAPQTAAGKVLAAAVMIMGYGVLAVPTGIVTVELSRVQAAPASRLPSASTRTCPQCAEEGHDDDAAYCKYCAAEL